MSRVSRFYLKHIIHHQEKRMGSLSKLAAGGGVVLSAVGLGIACNEIANTDNKQKKNEILAESLGGLLGGGLFGVGATILFIGTPIGWVAALAIGVGTVAASHGGGAFLQNLYTTSGSHIDFASLTSVNTVCR